MSKLTSMQEGNFCAFLRLATSKLMPKRVLLAGFAAWYAHAQWLCCCRDSTSAPVTWLSGTQDTLFFTA